MQNSEVMPPLPQKYKLPPIVNPIWHLSNLTKSSGACEKLKESIRDQYGVKHCMLLDRARSGLYLLIKGMGLSEEWISTSFMHRPASVVLKNFVKTIRLASIYQDFNIDVEDCESLITPQTQVIMASHIYGKAADVTRLREISDKNNIFLIENAVHMPGGIDVNGRRLGSWGDASILSFNVDKPAGAILGGALITNRDDVWEAVNAQPMGESNKKECWNRIYNSYLSYHLKHLVLKLPRTQHLREAKDGVKIIESFSVDKYKTYTPRTIHPLQAAAATRGIRQSLENCRKRIKNAEYLSGLLAQSDKLILPTTSPECPNTYLYYPIILKKPLNRHDIAVKLCDMGIETKWRYYPMHLQPGFTDCPSSDMSKTMEYWEQHLLIPCGVKCTESQLKYLADSLLSLL